MEGIENYEGYEAATDSIPLVNDATGQPIFLRRFHFQAPPDLEKWPSKKFIAEQHQPAIEKFLWRDEMKLIDSLRVIIDKTRGVFDIYAVCQPKVGSNLWTEKPKTLQEIFKTNETGGD